jgi:hypothetical protein
MYFNKNKYLCNYINKLKPCTKKIFMHGFNLFNLFKAFMYFLTYINLN